jgi:hypothetical protein
MNSQEMAIEGRSQRPFLFETILESGGISLRPNDYYLRHGNLQADKAELRVKEKLNLEIG